MSRQIPNSAPVRANTRCLQLACERLNIPFTIHDKFGNFLSIHLTKPYFFVNFSTPFNNGGVDRVCRDKEFFWRLLNTHVNMPRTRGYFDPKPADQAYDVYVQEDGYETIVKDILEEFSLPVVVKMNTGSQGKNVFLCRSETEVLAAISTIFDKNSSSYDYVALAQEYVERKKEYRVAVFRGEILLVYEKDFSEATFVGNLSPLHYDNALARYVDDPALKSRIQEFIRPLLVTLGLEFGGLDIVIDEHDKMYLLEVNTQPGFSYFFRDNGEEKLVEMYEKILTQLVQAS